ncbi:MAG: PAS domain S-box protein [Campylobacterota bacterium]|nr:PAS domain S-box protein [Campylobacterota bacterium]
MIQRDAERFKLGVTSSIVAAIVLVVLLIFISVYSFQTEQDKREQQEYSRKIDMSLEHTIKHFMKDYVYRTRRIVETTDIASMIESGDREAAYRLLEPKFRLMREESEHFKVMHLHLSDGSSFLRVHKREEYGDRISEHREMLRNIHKHHKLITGYETGKYATVYRVITPIFNKNGVYIGAFEVGVNPNFILNAVNNINGFEGMIFIKKDELQLYSKPNSVEIGEYRLQSDITPELKRICEISERSRELKSGIEIDLGDVKYITHLVTLKNFSGEESVKIIFFQRFLKKSLLLNMTQYYIYITVLFILVAMALYVYRRIGRYQKDVSSLYLKQIEMINKSEKELSFNKDYLESIFDVTPSVMIVTNGEEIYRANPAMLEFFGYESLEAFKAEHQCICEYFTAEKICLNPVVDGIPWLEYVLSRPDEIHYACMYKNDQRFHFIVGANRIRIDDKNRSVVIFNDITESEYIKERLEIAVNGTNDGLWDWNLQTGELYFSPQWKKQVGYEDKELENSIETWASLVHPDDKENAERDYTENMEGKTDFYENIHRLRHKDGSWVWILDRGQTKFDEDSKAVRMVGFHTDITKQKELELQLIENEKIYYDFFEHTKSANIMYSTDDDGKTFKIKTLNSLVEKLEDIKKDEVLGKRVDEVFEGIEEFGLLDIFRDVYRTGKPYKMPISYYSDENISGWRENYIFRLSNGDIVASYEDRTKEKELEVLLNNTINSVENLIFVKDSEFKYLESNVAFEKFIGHSRDELLGKEDYDLFDKEVADSFRAYDKKMLESGKTQSNYEWVTYPDGREVYLLTVKAPLRDASGKILGLVGNSVDMTAQKNLEDELRLSKEQFEQFMKYVPGSILIKDENARIVYANKTAKAFFNDKDIIGLKSEDLLSVEDVKTANAVDARILKERFIDEVDEYTNYDNEKRVFRTMGFVIEDEDSNKIGTIIVDITDEYKLKDALHEKEELMIAQSRHAAMGEMISMIAHQWRQPISVISMDANNILADIELEMVDEDTLRSASEDIIKQTQELSKTIDDFRNFFRPEKEAQEVVVKELFDDALAVIGKSLNNNQVEFILNIDEHKKITTYTRELMQVFINIIKNAKEALVDKRVQSKKISVYMSEDKNNLRLKICDNAGGVSEENMKKIFNPYFTTKGEKNGTGLGLYMSKTIVEKHLEGLLSVENDNEGACFTIELPNELSTEE